jgi:hypothetical protein
MSAHAGFIAGNPLFANGKTVSLQGLEWMPLTYTAGLSRSDIEDGFTDRFNGVWSANDWRYATRAETETLFGSLWDQTYDGWSKTNHAGASWFLSTFGGLMFDSSYGNSRIDGQYSNNADWLRIDGSLMFFGSNGECHANTINSCYGSIYAADNYFFSDLSEFNVKTRINEVSYLMGSGSLGWFNESYGGNHGIVTNNVAIRKNTTSPDFGSLLVRTPPNAATVSAPAAISLLALGLCGLALRRRRTVSE